jgi:hypothetical protein
MRPNKVYPVRVGWASTSGDRALPEGESPVTVRLIMAGAQVVPSEHLLDSSRPKAQVTFYVTPLANGPLRGERLEVIQQGRKIQEINTPAKTVRQRRTLIYFALAFILPWLFLTLFKYSPTEPARVAFKPDGSEEFLEKDKMPPMPAVVVHKQDGHTKTIKTGDPGERLRLWLDDNTPDVPSQVDDVSSDAGSFLRSINSTLGEVYTYLCDAGRRKPDLLGWTGSNIHLYVPVAYLLFILMLVLTIVSWLVNLERRKKRVSKPLPLGGGAGG